jgi:hypothetical protein
MRRTWIWNYRVSEGGAIDFRGEDLIVADIEASMRYGMSGVVYFVAEGGVASFPWGGRETMHGGWKSMAGKKTDTFEGRKQEDRDPTHLNRKV